ncbi:MAG: hypothetical protein ABIS14_05460 [Sphingomonas sp.]
MTTSFADPIALYHAVRRAWAPETVSSAFDPANPCRNQCAVTALAVQRLLGGEIVKTRTKGGTHFYNRIDGRYWDLATDQFDEPIPYENLSVSTDEPFEHATRAQLDTLLANIADVRGGI